MSDGIGDSERFKCDDLFIHCLRFVKLQACKPVVTSSRLATEAVSLVISSLENDGAVFWAAVPSEKCMGLDEDLILDERCFPKKDDFET